MDITKLVISSLSQMVDARQLSKVKEVARDGGIGDEWFLLEVATDLIPPLRGTYGLGYGQDRDGGRISFQASHKGDGVWELDWYRADRAGIQALPEILYPEAIHL
ncbi:MAG: hypothetical protein AB7N24_21180 [Dehalococcoidia bacterium]